MIQENYSLLAQAAPSTGTSTQQVVKPEGVAPTSPGSQDQVWQMFLPLALIVVFYFIFIRPQQKKEKERKEALNVLSKNDKVVTRGGIWGVVVGIKDEIVVLKIAENVKVEVSKNAIEVVNPEAEEKAKAKAK